MTTMLKLFAPDGAEVVATADWVPANAMLAPDGVTLTPDGALAVDFHDLRPAWDGVVTETEDGFPVYLSADGMRVREDALVLRRIDGDGAPVGAPVPFSPRRCGGPVFDEGVARRTAALLTAAENVVAHWARGDLAAAFRALDAAIAAMRNTGETGARRLSHQSIPTGDQP
jgi:hypothetical protein